MTASDIAHQFSRLIFAAVEAPESVNRNALLVAADAYLNAAPADDTAGPAMGATMAARAMDWAVFGHSDDYARLRRAVDCFRMHSSLINH
jgi:hypothetical protein